MIGAVIGDIIGSIYEFQPIKTTEFPFFGEGCCFTDDTVMTVAVAASLLAARDQSEAECSGEVIRQMQYWGRKYPHCGFGGSFAQWLRQTDPKPYHSWGNGSAMRVSGVGWLFDTIEETLHYAALTAAVTHDHPEGIKGAKAVAAGIFLLRKGIGLERTREYIRENYYADVAVPLQEIRLTYAFDVSCQGSVPQAMAAFFESTDFEDSIRKAVSLGGDSDTQAAIAGSLAEAYYGVPRELEEKALSYLDKEMICIYQQFIEMRR